MAEPAAIVVFAFIGVRAALFGVLQLVYAAPAIARGQVLAMNSAFGGLVGIVIAVLLWRGLVDAWKR